MLYCINNLKKGYNHAGSKAPSDVFQIASELGCGEIKFVEPQKKKSLTFTRLFAMPVGLKNWYGLNRIVQKGDSVILQHPNENIVVANKYIDYLKKKKNIRFIALIHDLNSIRKSFTIKSNALEKRNMTADDVLLKKCDYIICHNEAMKEFMIENGFESQKIGSLEIFDYLHDCKLPENRIKEKSIVIAGNLQRGKCEYLYKLGSIDEIPFKIHLFGPNYEGNTDLKNIFYHGQCSPDELPGKLEGSFGLVWDGTEIDKCAGNAGEYIRYNNPHKCSLFLASNMPVIIWKEAALADFVEKNKVGLTVNSLSEIGNVIDALTDEEYLIMLENVKCIGEKLRDGFYLKQAINTVLKNEMRLSV